jgi:PD-(D/E)XK nuclease superfamily protein
MTPFERHGIRHLSPSSLALYRAAPALWVLRYLFRVHDDVTAYAWRGKAVETAVEAVIDGASDEQAVAVAMQAFEKEAGGEIALEIDKERRAIPGMVRQAAPIFRDLGAPLARQYRTETRIDGIEVPIIGYADFIYEPFVIELKTTYRMPSKPEFDHCVQVVTYADVLKLFPCLLYIGPNRHAVYGPDSIDAIAARRTLRLTAFAIRAMLAAAETKEAAAAFFVPGVHEYRWSDTTRSAAAGVWS